MTSNSIQRIGTSEGWNRHVAQRGGLSTVSFWPGGTRNSGVTAVSVVAHVVGPNWVGSDKSRDGWVVKSSVFGEPERWRRRNTSNPRGGKPRLDWTVQRRWIPDWSVGWLSTPRQIMETAPVCRLM